MQLSTRGGDYVANFVEDTERILFDHSLSAVHRAGEAKEELHSFEAAGPRSRIFFNPEDITAAIVTCGGLCPGLNDVVRGLVLSLHYHYGVKNIIGIRYGYQGLVERSMLRPIPLNPRNVEDLQSRGGTFLGTSRGPQDPSEMVDFMVKNGINLLFTIGGDGTQRGAMAIVEEIAKRRLEIAVVGIPKTIDNDIFFVERSFGFDTAYSIATQILDSAHAEAEGAWNGITIVKLMGRQSGFLAATASVASGAVNFTLIPEVPFHLDPPHGFLSALESRILKRHHALVVVAEGAGQEMMANEVKRLGTDASGNPKLADVGTFLTSRVKEHFSSREISANVKYIDPSYIVRSLAAIPSDRMYCLQLAHNAVHAAMTGRTGMMVGYWNSAFTHVPIRAAVSQRKVVDPDGMLWLTVLQTNGQPKRMLNDA